MFGYFLHFSQKSNRNMLIVQYLHTCFAKSISIIWCENYMKIYRLFLGAHKIDVFELYTFVVAITEGYNKFRYVINKSEILLIF